MISRNSLPPGRNKRAHSGLEELMTWSCQQHGVLGSKNPRCTENPSRLAHSSLGARKRCEDAIRCFSIGLQTIHQGPHSVPQFCRKQMRTTVPPPNGLAASIRPSRTEPNSFQLLMESSPRSQTLCYITMF